MGRPNTWINAKGFQYWIDETWTEASTEYDSCKEDKTEALTCYWRRFCDAMRKAQNELEEREKSNAEMLEELLTSEELEFVKEKRGGNLFDGW